MRTGWHGIAMRGMRRYGQTIVLGILLLIPMREGNAQLSPGPLSKAHESLEGLQNCTQCHDQNQGQIAKQCLSCHMFMRDRIARGQGLHANPEFRECETCHVEHQGRDFDLIWWDGGEKAFDHARAGYRLEGAHARQECRACHQPKNIRRFRPEESDSARTFLGLDTSCVSCHTDEHRGQLGAACRDCHTLNAWKPAPGFDHSKTKFVLTGRHTITACDKCHATVADSLSAADPTFVRFAKVRHDQCTACHTDVHKGRFAAACESCHNTDSWRLTDRTKFDHSKTAYPLLGRHAAVTCDRCHPAGQPRRGVKFERCRDCHSDFHKGAFASRDSAGACEECHSVEGFTPASFSAESHNRTDFILAGAHLAVGCRSCHGEAHAKPPSQPLRFVFESTRCADCHKDPHRGTANRLAEFGCESCHTSDAWSVVQFDHARTEFPLTGKHSAMNCRSCHLDTVSSSVAARDTAVVFLKGLKDCADCHQDVHAGQFLASAGASPASAGLKTECRLCHTTERWKPSTFNHDLQSTYRLEGAHRRVPCTGCHKPTDVDGSALVRYKPTPRTCQECHGGTIAPLEEAG